MAVGPRTHRSRLHPTEPTSTPPEFDDGFVCHLGHGRFVICPSAPTVTCPRGRAVRSSGAQILVIADQHTITVIALATGEVLSTHDINPEKSYWRNTQRSPGRWPGLPVA